MQALVGFALFFAVGYGVAGGPILSAAAWSVPAAVLAIVSWVAARQARPRLAAWTILLAAAGCGAATAARAAREPPVSIAMQEAMGDPWPIVEGRVVELPERLYGRTHLVVDVDRVSRGGMILAARARVRFTVPSLEVAVSFGDRVRVRSRLRRPVDLGNPGESRFARRLLSRGIALTGFVAAADGVVVLGDREESGISGAMDDVRGELRKRIAAATAGEGSAAGALTTALFLGDRGGLSPADTTAFAAAGVSHVLAVSGQHLVIVSWLLYRCLAWLLGLWSGLVLRVDPRRPAAMAALAAAALYTVLCGSPPSAVRALAMAAVAALAILLGRGGSGPPALAAAVLGLTALEPWLLADPGFQLSVLSVAALCVFVPPLTRALERRRDDRKPGRMVRWMAALLASSLAAAAATVPLVAHYFHLVSPFGIFANLVVVPLLGIAILPLSLAGSLLVPVSTTISDLLFSAAATAAEGARAAAVAIASIPGTSFRVPPPSAIEAVLLTAGFFLLARWRSGRAWRFLALTLLCIPAALMTGRLLGLGQPPLSVTFFSVRHGDAALLRLPGRRAILVDGGGSVHGTDDIGPSVLVPALRRHGIMRLDAVVLTHPHPDHARGLAHVVRELEVSELWTNGRSLSPGAADLAAAVRERGVPIRIYRSAAGRAGSPVRIPFGPAVIELLHPILPDDNPEPYFHELGENDNSIVMRVTLGAASLLLTGDLEAEGEEVLLESSMAVRSTVLKVPHHGSRTSTTPSLLRAVAPRLSIISCGRSNRYGLPNEEVLHRLRQSGTLVFRTDEDGAITVDTDGHRLTVRAHRSGRNLQMFLDDNKQR